MNRKQTLDRAKELICGQREEDYGDPRDNFQLIADMWSTWINARCKGGMVALEPGDVAVMNQMLKQARLVDNMDYPDGWVDIAGYAALGAEVTSAPAKPAGDETVNG